MRKEEVHILYLGNVLSNYGFTPTTVETLSARLQKDISVTIASNKKNKLLRLLHMWAVVFRFRKKINLVLIDTYSSSAFLFAWTSGFLCSILNIPYMAYLHGGDLPKRFKASKKISRRYLKQAKQIVAPSGYLNAAVQKQFGINGIIIPNYIDLDNYPYQHRSEIGTINLLWVRSFHKTYQPHLAVEIVSILKASGLETTLTMVGPDKDGSQQACKNRATELGVADCITFTNRLTKEAWIKLSQKHNIFLNTTSIDNTPVSVMEAMALGMPVVTTKVGGIPFLFEDEAEGIMVETQTADALANAILRLHQFPELTNKISENARKKAELWDWKVVRKQWLRLLVDI